MSLLALVLAVVLALAALAALSARRSRTDPPPPDAFVEARGARIHAVSRGAGRPVVFLHGNDATHLDFTLSLLDRAALEYRAVALDRPGHGHSTRPRGSASVAAQMEILREALRRLGVEQPILVGHSWSGALVLAWALAHPEELSGVVVLAGAVYAKGSGLFPDPRFITLLPIVGRTAWSCGALFARPFVRKAIRAAFSPAPVPPHWQPSTEPFQIWNAGHVRAAAEDFLASARDVPALSPHYPEIRIPVVIVTGDRDAAVPPAQHAYRLAKDLPSAVLITVPGAGHMLPFTHPDEVMDAIRRVAEASTSHH